MEKRIWRVNRVFCSSRQVERKNFANLHGSHGKTLKSPPPGLKIHNIFWTLGQYDFIIIYEAPNEKAAIKMGTEWVEFCDTQTLVAVPNEEAKKMLFK
jgi:hypothetical protein